MAKPDRSRQTRRDSGDTFSNLLDSVSRFCLWVGIISGLAGFGFLVYYYMTLGTGMQDAQLAAAAKNIPTFTNALYLGIAGLAIGTTIQFWGEEVLGILQAIVGGFLCASQIWLGMLSNTGAPNPVQFTCSQALQKGGVVLLLVGVGSIIFELVERIKIRAREGSKADKLKYGKGIKEDDKYQNVFLGKCWQLPFCRKYVREHCPIFHAKRTCWKERVGCMCDEAVINNAMKGGPIPKDALMAAKYIPRDSKLSEAAKAQRCRDCTIYNEHQKHKYKLVLPVSVITTLGIYFFDRQQLLGLLDHFLFSADKFLASATMTTSKGIQIESIGWIREVILVAAVLVILAYMLKLVEYLIFVKKI